MKRALLTFLLLTLPLAAQTTTTVAPAPQEQRLFLLKYADPNSVSQLLQAFHVNLQSNMQMRALTVSASKETMAAIEDAIKRLDVPSAAPMNVELTVYMLVGHGTDASAGGSPAPKELEGVITQLKNTFAFKGYSLMDTLQLRTATGMQAGTSSSGGEVQIPGGPTQPVKTTFDIRGATISGDGSTIHIEHLQANSKVPVSTGQASQFMYQDLGLNTNIDVKEGQKVVIGRLSISKDQALFLVLTVKILQ